MRSIIVMRGLVKKDKEAWVRKEHLENFLVDLDNLKSLYYKPDYKGDRDFLIRSMDDIIYRRAIEIIISHLTSGTLVVLDWELETTVAVEQLAVIFGYTVFYKIFQPPQDYVKRNRKYMDSRYLPRSKEELRKELEVFGSFDYLDKLVIRGWSDIETYWKHSLKVDVLDEEAPVLHVSDLHSHWDLITSKLPEPGDYARAVFHGDYIDGPEKGGSRKIIDQVLATTSKGIIFLEGNHELRLRKYLGWRALRSSKRIISETLLSDLPEEFLAGTAKEFDDLNSMDSWRILIELNSKLREFYIYQRGTSRYYCSHCGLRWVEQVSPKYIGNLINTNKYVDRVDEAFEKNYAPLEYYSIHGHCHYSDFEYQKYDHVINIDPFDENQVNYFENKPNKNIEVCAIEQEN